jgi:hypothetical protein
MIRAVRLHPAPEGRMLHQIWPPPRPCPHAPIRHELQTNPFYHKYVQTR